jgi:glycosyltransferase involved in cell wall biosynthesis
MQYARRATIKGNGVNGQGLALRTHMRVGFLVNSVSREAGGLFHSVRGLANAVVSANLEARVFSMSDPNSAVDVLKWRPLSVRTFRPQSRSWGYSNELLPALLDANPDILSTHGLWKYCSVASGRWHRQTRRPYIVHPHGMLEPWALQNARWKKRIAALLYEDRHLHGAACLRALCEAEAQSIRTYGVRNPISVIPNGVDLPQLTESSVAEPASPAFRTFAQGRKILLYLGRLHPKKNVANLIRAWKQSLNSHPSAREDWALAIAGWDQDGYERELKTLTSDYGLMASVGFLGPLFGQEKDAAYRACDAFVLPSLSEGLPMAVLEAWAYAKPVLMTAECNLPEGFAAGAAVQIGTTPAEIAAGLKKLTEMSDSDRTAMGGRGRTLVATKFSWPRIGEQMRSVYDWVVGGGAPPEGVNLIA